MPTLHAARYNVARSSLLENIEQPANVGVRWALPGGLQRLEVTVKAKSRQDAYDRYQNHLGHGMALYDSWGVVIQDGWVFEVIPDGRHVTYIVLGPWKRLSQNYATTAPSAAQATSAYLSARLADTNPAVYVSSDHANMNATGVTMDGWLPDIDGGTRLDQVVDDILKMGTSVTGEVLDFWLISNQQFSGVLPQKPLPYLKPRSSASWLQLQVDLKDLRDVSFARNIYDLANSVTMRYSLYTLMNGAHAAGATTITVDSSAGFVAGREVEIQLDDGRRHTTTVDSTPTGATFTITDDLPYTAPDNGYVWLRKPLAATAAATDSNNSQTTYWVSQLNAIEPSLFNVSGPDYRDIVYEEKSLPRQLASFTIGSRWFKTTDGRRWPLWRMLHNPGWIRINDLYPAASLTTLSLDALRVFRIVALDYDHAAGVMRVTPDTLDGEQRLDVILQRMGVDGIGQAVGRYYGNEQGIVSVGGGPALY